MPFGLTNNSDLRLEVAQMLEQIELLFQMQQECDTAAQDQENVLSQIESIRQGAAQLYEQVESLNDSNEAVDTSSDQPQSEPERSSTEELSELLNVQAGIFDHKLEQFSNQILKSLDSSASPGELKSMLEQQQQELQSFAEALTKQFDKKTDETMSLIEREFESRLNRMEENVSQIAETIREQKQILASLETNGISASPIIRDSDSPNTSDLVTQIQNRFDELFDSISEKLSGLTSSTGTISSTQETHESADTVQDSQATEEAASHWEKQKADMLSKYGIDPAYRPSNDPEPPRTSGNNPPQNDRHPIDSAPQSEPQTPQAENGSNESNAIDEIKARLTAKLRESEVELSITRAKLSQQRAELEQRQVEIERREKMLEQKFGQKFDHSKQSDPIANKGVLNRMARHLGMGKQDEE